MSLFPTDWDIYEDDDFATFDRKDTHDSPMGACTLIRLGADGRSLGIFRIVAYGGGTIEIDIPVRHVLPDPPPHLADLIIRLSAKADGLIFPHNATTAAWRDLLQLLLSATVTLLDQEGTTIDANPLIAFLNGHTASSDRSTVGVSFRWAVAVGPTGEHRLELQSLPTQARYLSKANLKQDNSVSVLLGSFPLEVELFAGPHPAGPVPLIFTANRDKAVEQLRQNPDPLRADIAAVNATLLQMEHLTLEEANSYLQGRARAAKGTQAYPPRAVPPAKKQRTTQATARDTGNPSLY